MFTSVKTAASKTLRAATENKYTRPVVMTAAVPVLVVAMPVQLIALNHRTNKEIRTAKKNGTL